jgi:hypothetical protein
VTIVANLPDWLGEPLRLVLHDLQQPRAVPLELRLQNDETLWLDRGTSIWIPPEEQREPNLVVWLADQLQEQFFPESFEAWGEARPACPGHTHPAIPVADGGGGWWVCPRDSNRIAAIGEYASAD